MKLKLLNLLLRCFLLSLAAGAGALLTQTPAGRAIGRNAYDHFVSVRPASAFSEKIIVVGIDQPSFDKLKQPWPWPAELHINLVSSLFNAGAKVVALDFLDTDTANASSKSAIAFAKTAERYPQLVLADILQSNKDTSAIKLGAERYGFIDLVLDSDKVVREAPLRKGERSSLPLLAASLFAKSTDSLFPNNALINFKAPPQTVHAVSYYQALKTIEFLPQDLFTDKIVLVGFFASSIEEKSDLAANEYQVPYSQNGNQRMSKVEVHTNIIQNILDNEFVTTVPKATALKLGFALALLCGVVCSVLSPIYGLTAFLIFNGIALTFSYQLFAGQLKFLSPVYVVFPLVLTYICVLFSHWAQGQTKFQRLKSSLFGTFSQPRAPANSSLKGCGAPSETSTGVALCVQLECLPSKSKSEKSKAAQDKIASFLEETATLVAANGGRIETRAEETLTAIWEINPSRGNIAIAVSKTALLMRKQFEKFNRHRRFTLKIGMVSGEMSSHIGAAAARLASWNRVYRTQILLDAPSAAQVLIQTPVRQIDTLRVSRQNEIVKIYEINLAANTNSSQFQNLFQQGRTLYSQGFWQEAIEQFESALELNAEDGPTLCLKGRCTTFLQYPPSENWNGVFQM